jgi:hypothetical protein
MTRHIHLHRSRSINARDAALRKLRQANRALLAGSVLLTGVLADVASASFKGSTRHSGSGSQRSGAHHAKKSAQLGPTPAVSPPSEPPAAAGQTESESEQSTTTPEESSQATGSPEAASEPAPESSAPSESSEPKGATPQQNAELEEIQREREEPVVSGGS